MVEGRYQVQALRGEWSCRATFHQLHSLLTHLVLFGSGYAAATEVAAAATLRIYA